MNEYHKIQTVYKRDQATNHKTLLEGEFSVPAFEYLKDNMWTFTEKIDGTNIRIMYDGSVLDKGIVFGGKTDNSNIPAFLFQKLQELFSRHKLYSVFGENKVCLYGEGYGAKIEKGGGNYISDGCGFILFDVKIDNWWLKRDAVAEIGYKLGIPIVPTIGGGTLAEAVYRAKIGFDSKIGNHAAEGLVMRPVVEMFERNGNRIIAKIKCKDFL